MYRFLPMMQVLARLVTEPKNPICVTKSVSTPNVIIGGNPAKVIGSTQDYIMKHKSHFYSLNGLSEKQREEVINNNQDKLVKR